MAIKTNKKLEIKDDGKLLLTYNMSETTGEWMAVHQDRTTVVTEQSGTYLGGINNGEFNGSGNLVLKRTHSLDYYMEYSYIAKDMTYNTMSFKGKFVNGKLHGQCEVYLHHDSYGSKLFLEGLFEVGYCVYGELINDEDTFYYKGPFKKNIPDGGNVTMSVDDVVYSGRLVFNDLYLTDKIIEINSGKTLYTGELNGLQKHGFGKTSWYEGYWKNDEYHGFGFNNSSYPYKFGNWVQGKLHGEALVYGKFGGIYICSYEEGKLKSISVVRGAGRIEKFNFDKGFGFIELDLNLKYTSIFVHIKDIKKEEREEILLEQNNCKVCFSLEKGKESGKFKATKVYKAGSPIEIYPPTIQVLETLKTSYKLIKIQ